MQELRVCRSLGISLKRFHGWTPTRDDAVEWDETERNWMLALDDYEHSLCPSCGMPLSVCGDMQGQYRIQGDARVCWGTAHRIQAAKNWREENPQSKWGDALVVGLAMT